MYGQFVPEIIPKETIEPQVFLELNIGKIETKDLYEGDDEHIAIDIAVHETSTFESRMAVLEALKCLDINVGAVVTKRANYPTTRVMPLYWGIVTNMVAYLHNKIDHKPYMVRWIDSGNVSYHTYSELILISYAPDEEELAAIRVEPGLGGVHV